MKTKVFGKKIENIYGVDHKWKTIKDENGEYKKHFIGLSDNVTYVVEDITSGDVSKYSYTLNFNPNMWIPVDVEKID